MGYRNYEYIIYLHDTEDDERLDHVIFLEKSSGEVTGIFIRGMNPLLSPNSVFDVDDFNLFSSYDGLIERKDNVLLRVEQLCLFFSAEYNELLGVFLSDADDSNSLFILFLHDQLEVKKGCSKLEVTKVLTDIYSKNGFSVFPF